MKVADIIYQTLQERLGHPCSLTVEDLVHVSCGYRHYLRLIGQEAPPEDAKTVLLRAYTHNLRQRIIDEFMLPGGVKNFQKLSPLLVEDTLSVDVAGTFDGWLLDVVVVPERAFQGGIPNNVKLAAAIKAALYQEESILVLLVDQNKLDWAAWSISGDFGEIGDLVRREAVFIRNLAIGTSCEMGTASTADCRVCPYKQVCTATKTGEVEPLRVSSIRIRPDALLTSNLDTFLWSLNKPRRYKNAFHPSEFTTNKGSCDRCLAYGLLGEERRERIDPKLRRIFTAGHALHDVLQWAIGQALPDARCEVPVVHNDLSIRGSCDEVIGDTGYEYKSIGHAPFEKLTSPKTEHVKQGSSYCAILELLRVLYLYVDKETGDIKEFDTVLDRRVWHAISARLANIKKTVSLGALPDKTDKQYLCKECPYSWVCSP